MNQSSSLLHNYTGANPFREAQAKTFGEDKLVREFCPTSSYLSLFNEQHEVLLGSRGSGKTTILRMLSYGCLRNVQHPAVKQIAEQKKFFGFYIPLHLEFMASLPSHSGDGEERMEFFRFAFNCAAVKSFLTELKAIIRDTWNRPEQRIVHEESIIRRIVKLWFETTAEEYSNLDDVADRIDHLYFQQQPWADGEQPKVPLFAKELFAPIMAVLPQICRELEIRLEEANWLACVDEAEFLKPAYLRCFNSFMRTEKRPIVLKLATLPFKYFTADTTVDGVACEPNGNDFNFRSIDMSWDDKDFQVLTDSLTSGRLGRLQLYAQEGIDKSLAGFLGKIGGDDPKDYFRCEVGETEGSESAIIAGIVRELSPERQARFQRLVDQPDRIASDYLKKFGPVYYMRVMRRRDSQGNRNPGFFAGPSLVRRVADGNPRRFIQLMHSLFEEATSRLLSWKRQHYVIFEFSRRDFERAAGLPESGLMLDGILQMVGELMAERVHRKDEMIEGGYNFSVKHALVRNAVVRSALELGVAYRFLFVDERSLFHGITAESEFRVAHLVAVKYWLPMRKGTKLILRSKHERNLLKDQLLTRTPVTMKEKETAIGSLQLEFELSSHESHKEDSDETC